MKHNLKITLMYLILTLAVSCKKKTDPVEDPKTLTKSLLYDKLWYNKGGTMDHIFNSNGKYYNNLGTWQWLNNSDSMEVKITSSGQRFVWYFEWNTEHEFSAKPSKTSAYILFKDQQW